MAAAQVPASVEGTCPWLAGTVQAVNRTKQPLQTLHLALERKWLLGF